MPCVVRYINKSNKRITRIDVFRITLDPILSSQPTPGQQPGQAAWDLNNTKALKLFPPGEPLFHVLVVALSVASDIRSPQLLQW
ncbi:unnamed protein product [Schistocephalus solidus]|uniref:Uncharacterized protein n=1 Tax=Schistocephalus solidus TaxID=70667 RepID=A0A183TKP0_SCHSO|nr:unnamed protein product [Schistocephalus solidus]